MVGATVFPNVLGFCWFITSLTYLFFFSISYPLKNYWQPHKIVENLILDNLMLIDITVDKTLNHSQYNTITSCKSSS